MRQYDSLEAGIGDDRVEVARDYRHASDEDGNREEDDGVEHAAYHGGPLLRSCARG